jgi:hypothetical protein
MRLDVAFDGAWYQVSNGLPSRHASSDEARRDFDEWNFHNVLQDSFHNVGTDSVAQWFGVQFLATGPRDNDNRGERCEVLRLVPIRQIGQAV